MKRKQTTTAWPAALMLAAGIMLEPVARSAEPSPSQTETPVQREARTAWWREARFGMFIHWGPVSLKGTEISWSRANSNPKCPNHGPIPVEVYDHLYKQFDPVQFNADEWAALAKQSGMKYVVLTAKHCDSFLLWHSKVSDYNIAATPFQRDVCAELAEAVRKQGLRLGWYFSPMDWRDPDFRTDRNAAFVQRMQGELRELLSNYGTVDLLWFDTDGHSAMYDQANTYRLVKNLQPPIVINNRLDMGSMADYHAQKLSPNTDYYTPEQRIGAYDDQRPWETCMTLGSQWAWKPNDRIKSMPEVVALLARCVCGDGNLLLNVGPMPDGRIEPRQVEVLQGVGRWLRQNSESIYGTRGGPFEPGDYGGTTRKGKTAYVHVLKWPQEGALKLPNLTAKLVGARLLSDGKVETKQSETGLEIAVAPSERVKADTVVALEFDSDIMKVPVVKIPEAQSR